MEDNYQKSQVAMEVRKKFEETLRKHVRRLAGISHEFSNILMSLDLLTLSTTVLIVEREKELHEIKDNPPKRYTDESLLHGLTELGLDDLKKVRMCLQVLIQKKYILETKEGLAATPPAFKLVIFFDTIFPNMPGLSLVAYFNQIGEEVITKRKTLDLALAQIDKTLKIQGNSLIKKSSKKKSQKKMLSSSKSKGNLKLTNNPNKKKAPLNKLGKPQNKAPAKKINKTILQRPIKKGK